MPLSNRARLALAAFATGLTGTDYAGIVQGQIDSKQRQDALEARGVPTDLPIRDQLSIAQMDEIKNREAEKAFYNSKNNNTQPTVIPEVYPRIDTMSQVVGSDPVQAFNNFRSGNLIDPRTAGGLNNNAPLSLRQRAAEKAVDINVKNQGEALRDKEKVLNERLLNAETGVEDFETFSKEFQLSQAELIKEYGDTIDDATLAAWGLRQYAKIAQKFGVLPETEAFRDSIQAFATPLAKTAGEDRLTNEDIVRFTALLQDSLGSSSEANARKMRNLLNKFSTKGADLTVILDTFSQMGGTLGRAAELYGSFDADVKAAGDVISGKDFSLQTPQGYKYRIIGDE